MIVFEQVRPRLQERLEPLHSMEIMPDGVPQAAVTLILREFERDVSLLIIKRAVRSGDPWSGHLALPGGRAQTEDRDLLATAARETFEETGIDLFQGNGSGRNFLGKLPVLKPNNNRIPAIEITPFVAHTDKTSGLLLSDEVQEAFWVSINTLKTEGRSSSYSLKFGDIVSQWPAYPSQSGPIWGITERILTNFLSLID